MSFTELHDTFSHKKADRCFLKFSVYLYANKAKA